MRHTSSEEVVMEKSASTSYVTRAEELLSAMSDEEVKSDKKRSYKIPLQNILVTCCCILAIAAACKGFLYLDNGISTVESTVGSAAKDLSTLKAQVTAADTREQLVTVTAEMEDLRATNTQLRTELEQIRDTFEAWKAKKNNIVSAQHKR
jgi:predicted RNase H-like nuclease (RuvC/YqgF family)